MQTCYGFPRPRGDRPQRVDHLVLCMTGSPAHAGIDRPLGGSREPAIGSPAHAGIDPGQPSATSKGPGAGFPRPRGDRPVTGGAWCPLLHGSPAHAGIDPGYRLDLCARRRPGSPAHAGIDPERHGCWFPPPTRG